jgi:hypothetical protein
MAAAYIHVYADGKRIRTFGGNVSDVRKMKAWYESASLDDLRKGHPWLTEKQRRTLQVTYHRKY